MRHDVGHLHCPANTGVPFLTEVRVSPERRRSGASKPRSRRGPPSPGSTRDASADAPRGTGPEDSAPSLIVGVGASAGGLEAFGRLLETLPADTRAGFVLLQHLAPAHESMLATLLARHTSLEVVNAENGMRVEPARVHVLPPDAMMWISGGVLHLAHRRAYPAPNLPIDEFFESLAADQGPRAVGVVLSGTGADGMRGLSAIKERGGITFAQDEASAQFTTMPRNASASGHADFVQPPEEIAREIVRLASVARPSGTATGDAGDGADESALQEIFVLLHQAVGVDFSTYRQSTVRRRILRRMELMSVPTLAELVRRLRSSRADLEALSRDIFIQVTSFFRDPEAFAALQAHVFPALFATRSPREPIRVWVPGCATGEEAYSIAISIAEYRERAGVTHPVQIFATDITPTAIATARAGIYPARIAEDVSAERLERFFVRAGDSFQVGKALREMCVFAEHDLANDPPFSKLDLISCRNLLIYLPALQPRIFGIFHYALLPNGFLLLGSAETALFSSDLFAPVDGGARIFARRDVARPRPSSPASRRSASAPGGDDREPRAAVGRGSTRLTLRAQADRMLLARYVPAAVIVDRQLEVIDVRGDVGPYLQFRPGKLGAGLLRMARRSGLSSRLAAVLRESQERGAVVRAEQVPVTLGDREATVAIEAVPLGAGETALTMVLFEPDSAADDRPAAGAADPSATALLEARDQQIRDLRRELADIREQISALMEEHEERLEESQSATEEALSNSEELQSINEELETTKEELQATNEELVTVNAELESRNTELQHAQDLTDAIVATIPEPLVVLAEDLTVRSANLAYYEFSRSTPEATIGRSLFQLDGGAWNVPVVRGGFSAGAHLEELFQELELGTEAPNAAPRTVLLTARRLRGLDLILLAIRDETRHRAAEQALRLADQRLGEVHKMEAIGRLAGGVAHDFNNLLTVIIGYADLMLLGLTEQHRAHDEALQIRSAADRAVAITRQLLAFSRRQVMQPRHLDLNIVLHDMASMLRRLVGENITLELDLDTEPQWVRADPGQISQVILNLTLNARDAIAGPGHIRITTAPIEVTAADSATADLAAGRFVRLRVEDDGIGMSPETLARCFEPFFTTKPTGEGTGLGLATVSGIIEQSGGRISVRSAPGRGATFTIHLPCEASAPAPTPVVEEPRSDFSRGDETVLLVEDEDAIRRLARTILEEKGYTVLEAANGREALEASGRHAGTIDLVVSDVLMPVMGGRELVQRLQAERPSVRVLLISGYTEDEVLREGIHRSDVPFLHKPFRPSELAHTVREVLDAAAPPTV